MRVNLLKSKHRPWYMSLGLRFARWRVGAFPGPPLMISYKPGFFQRDFISYIIRAMAGSGGWNKGEAELFASFVSKLNTCRFWLEAHAAVAALHLPQDTLDAVLEDWTTAQIPEKTRGALKLLEFMTVHPQDIDKQLINELSSVGLDKLAIQEAANVGFHYNLITRVADAFDFPVPQGVQQERLARMLNFTGKLLKGSKEEEVWVEGEGGVIRPPEVEQGRQHMLKVQGATDPVLRKAIEAFVHSCWGATREMEMDLPNELKTYLEKLSLYAYRILDEDVEYIIEQGYSEEMIYEITLVGAVGAALVGLEAVYGYLYG